MMKLKLLIIIFYLFQFSIASEMNLNLSSQDSLISKKLWESNGPGWGYNYDSLLNDLKCWQENDFVSIDSIGASVENRALWKIIIHDTAFDPQYRIMIHARTHPMEVQSSWVTNELIKILLSESTISGTLLKNCEFVIVPMYNPDGVELGLNRENANGIDLESSWNREILEPETAVLKSLFEQLMESNNPIKVALNIHSSSKGTRFFICHDSSGTSAQYFEDEKFFIGSVHHQWPQGIQNWDYMVTWKNGTPDYYPESWFWINYQESVMALTYEDIFENNRENGQYTKTAESVLQGIITYLNLDIPVTVNEKNQIKDEIIKIFPNPLKNNQTLKVFFVNNKLGNVHCTLYNILGQKVFNEFYVCNFYENLIEFNLSGLSSGKYFFSITVEKNLDIFPITILK